MPFDPVTKLLYIHIPKTAGTTITELLDFKEGREFCFILNQKKDPVAFHHMTPTQLEKHGLLTKDEILESFAFTFVRNPFDRMVSEFHYRNQGIHPDEDPVERFQRFLAKIRKYFSFRRWNAYDNHLRPQWHFLRLNKRTVVKHVFRFEEFKAEIEKLKEIVEKEQGITVKDSKLAHRRKSIRAPYQEYYNTKTRRLVAKWYAKDIKIFGYTF